MKNANDAQRRALRERASRLRLPPLERGPDGHLSPQSLALVRDRALRIAWENRIVGLALVLCAPERPEAAMTAPGFLLSASICSNGS